MGDRYFDLGNLSVNNGFAEADDERLLAAYWGEPCTRAALRRAAADADHVRLPRGDVGRRPDAPSPTLDFDFAAYAEEHLDARGGRPGRPARRDLAGGRPWRSAVTCPRARAA